MAVKKQNRKQNKKKQKKTTEQNKHPSNTQYNRISLQVTISYGLILYLIVSSCSFIHSKQKWEQAKKS